tara:strand:+ start:1466 stop:1648 length:183 start_codon:yes stop_codon:yes gene_type:complete
MNITNAHIKQLNGEDIYIEATIDSRLCTVPLDGNNYEYNQIIEQVEAGILVLDDPVVIEE